MDCQGGFSGHWGPGDKKKDLLFLSLLGCSIGCFLFCSSLFGFYVGVLVMIWGWVAVG